VRDEIKAATPLAKQARALRPALRCCSAACARAAPPAADACVRCAALRADG